MGAGKVRDSGTDDLAIGGLRLFLAAEVAPVLKRKGMDVGPSGCRATGSRSGLGMCPGSQTGEAEWGPVKGRPERQMDTRCQSPDPGVQT